MQNINTTRNSKYHEDESNSTIWNSKCRVQNSNYNQEYFVCTYKLQIVGDRKANLELYNSTQIMACPTLGLLSLSNSYSINCNGAMKLSYIYLVYVDAINDHLSDCITSEIPNNFSAKSVYIALQLANKDIKSILHQNGHAHYLEKKTR